jgi:hypothetical protein
LLLEPVVGVKEMVLAEVVAVIFALKSMFVQVQLILL